MLKKVFLFSVSMLLSSFGFANTALWYVKNLNADVPYKVSITGNAQLYNALITPGHPARITLPSPVLQAKSGTTSGTVTVTSTVDANQTCTANYHAEIGCTHWRVLINGGTICLRYGWASYYFDHLARQANFTCKLHHHRQRQGEFVEFRQIHVK